MSVDIRVAANNSTSSYCVRLYAKALEEANEQGSALPFILSWDDCLFEFALKSNVHQMNIFGYLLIIQTLPWYPIFYLVRLHSVTRPFTTPYICVLHWCITRIKTSNESQSNECCTRAGFPSAWFRHAVYVYRLYISSYDLKLIVFKLCLSDIGIMRWYGTWCVYACAMIQRWYSSNRSLSRSSLFHPLSLSRRSTTMSSP